MRASLTLAAFLLAVLPSAARAEAAPPVRRVILSSHGLAQIERDGEIDGDAVLDLAVPLDAVDDVLKSLIVYDPAGRIEGVSLPGKQPLSQLFRSLPLKPEDLESPTALLTALRGAEVAVGGERRIAGRIVGVVQETGGEPEKTRNRLTLMTPAGLESVVVEQAGPIAFTDPVLRAQVEKALAATLANKAQDTRTVSIALGGGSRRPVTLTYVVAAPVWKTAYRLVVPETSPGKSPGESPGALPAAEPGHALLQGWAVLENMSGSDWDGVELVLTSGDVAAVRQPLYESYWASRPEIPVAIPGRPLPRKDTGAIAVPRIVGNTAINGRTRALMMGGAEAVGAAPPAPAIMAPAPKAGPAPDAPAQAASAAEAVQGATQVVFRFPGTFSVASGHSLTVPFANRSVPAERVWDYQPDVDPRHPVAAVRLTNDGDADLPAGVFTVYAGDRSEFAGDADVAVIPRGDSRLIGFAIDQRTLIDREERGETRVTKVAAAEGVVRISSSETATTVYTLKAPPDEARTVILEHPRRAGWDISIGDGQSVETAATAWRVRVEVPAGATRQAVVRLSHPLVRTERIQDMDAAALGSLVPALAASPAAAQSFEKLAELRRTVARADAEIAQNRRAIDDIAKDQERIRANLQAVPKTGDLARGYLDSLGRQETDIAEIRRKIDAAGESRKAALAEFNRQVAALKID